VKTAFPDGPPPGVTLPAGQRDLKASVKPLDLVVFADTDLLSDYLWVQELQQTEQQLTLLQSKRNDKSTLILTPAQQQEIEHFETEKLRIRKQLRAVQAGLVGDIDRLGTELKAIDIIVMPGLFALAALLIAAIRRRRPHAVSSKE